MGSKKDQILCFLSISCHVAMGLLKLQSCSNVSGTPTAVSLPLFLCCNGCAVAMFLCVSSSPFTWNNVVVVILPVHSNILDRRISHARAIVTADGSENDIGGYLGSYLLAKIPKAFSQTLQQWLVR